MLNKMNEALQNEVRRDIYGKILLNNKIFSLNFSKEFIFDLCLRMKEKRVCKNF